MPIPCQGFTLTWGGTSLSEVQELELNLQRDLPLGRTTTWTPSLGTINLLGFSTGRGATTATLAIAEYGKRRQLVIQAPAATAVISNRAWPHNGTTATATPAMTLCNVDCIYRGAKITASANGVVRFAHVFKVMDTVGAPTNP
jgi:hypothetical protein